MADEKRDFSPSETEKEKPDFFDRVMLLPLLRLFYPFYKKNKAVLLYLFFGAVTTLADFLAFFLLYDVAGTNEHFANIAAWIFAVFVAYVTNRIFVFESDADGAAAILAEILRFAGGRLATLAFEEAAIYVFVTRLRLYALAVKAVVAVAVVILNYVLSKIFVFRRKKPEK